MPARDATKIVGDPKDDTPAEGVTPEQQIEDSEKLVDKVLDQHIEAQPFGKQNSIIHDRHICLPAEV